MKVQDTFFLLLQTGYINSIGLKTYLSMFNTIYLLQNNASKTDSQATISFVCHLVGRFKAKWLIICQIYFDETLPGLHTYIYFFLGTYSSFYEDK